MSKKKITRKKLKQSLSEISQDLEATRQTYRDTLLSSLMFQDFMRMGEMKRRKKKVKNYRTRPKTGQ